MASGKTAGATAGERAINSVQNLARAEWVLERWQERPSLLRSYSQMMKEIRNRFECGKTAAEQAIKLARSLLRKDWDDIEQKQELAGLLQAKYLELAERAAAEPGSAGAVRAARILEMLAKLRGLSAPDQVEHSGTIDVGKREMADLTDAQLAALAAMGDAKAPTTH